MTPSKKPFNISGKNHISVLHVSSAKGWRGGQQQLANLCKELNKLNVVQTVFCIEGDEMQKWCIKNDITQTGFKKKGSISISNAFSLKKLAQYLGTDIVHTHDSHAHTMAVLASITGKKMPPIVSSRRVDFPIATNIFSKWKYDHKNVKRIICVSNAIKSIVQRGIKHKDKAVTVHS
ncbi:MAG: glycosyltransferase, partial [Flavobacteriales bacterium]